MRLRVMRGAGSGSCWPRQWWLGVVLAAFLVGAASARAQPFVYVAIQGEDASLSVVSQYDAMGGALSSLTPGTVGAGIAPLAVAVSPGGKSVYVTDEGTLTTPGMVSQYDVGTGGVLTPKSPPTVAAGGGEFGAFAVAVNPDGKSVYVTDSTGGAVFQYDVGVGGALTPKSPASVTAPVGSRGIAVGPDGKSVYVANGIAGTVSQYDVGQGGALIPKTPATVAAGVLPSEVAVSPDGTSVYVTDAGGSGDGRVSQYDVGPGGALTPKTPASVAIDNPAGTFPNGIAITPDGKSVYVANEFSVAAGSVSQFDVGPNGQLAPKTPAAVAIGSGPVEIAVSPDGKSVYVTDIAGGGTVLQFDVGADGSLSPKTPSAVPAGPDPNGIAVSPLPRVHATATGVSCSPRTFAPGDVTVCKATVTDTASSGQTMPTGTVSFTNSGAGSFFGNLCILSGSGASASCTVFFTSFARGGHIVAAAYGGDATHGGSHAITGATVAVPASTAGCVVFGHGRITAANGDKASFRGLAAATPPRGVEFYRDNGPANPVRAASTSVDGLTCTDDATKASVFGTAKVNGGSLVEYRIDVQLTVWEGGIDTYRIRLSNGYDSGARKIRHGDVDIRLHSSEHHHHDANAGRYKPGASQDGG